MTCFGSVTGAKTRSVAGIHSPEVEPVHAAPLQPTTGSGAVEQNARRLWCLRRLIIRLRIKQSCCS